MENGQTEKILREGREIAGTWKGKGDVYKRQATYRWHRSQTSVVQKLLNKNIGPVSYTHLDVYKRQP